MTTTAERTGVLLRIEGIDKRYPGVHALKQVDFDLEAGEVHVLLGENGAGKSTLVKILSGAVERDAGRITIGEEVVENLTPEMAHRYGIGMVYQELSLIPALTVAENIFLGNPPRNRLRLVDWSTMRDRARTVLTELGVDIDLNVQVRTLSVAEQQLVEIARVLAWEPRILLLDEPTSALSDAERERLFDILRHLQGRGVGIVFISHPLGEVPLIARRVTVLRDGKRVGTLPVDEADEDTLVHMMVGRTLHRSSTDEAPEGGEILLEVEGLSVPRVLHDISFRLHRGEILGVFGLMGAGQIPLARAIFGLEPRASLQLRLEGKPIRVRHPGEAIGHGLGLLGRDRREGLFPVLAIPPNVTMARVTQKALAAPVMLRDEARVTAGYVRDLGIQTPSLDRPVQFLSGGNQQKVILARWLYSDAKVLIFDEPTRGIDVGAKQEVFNLMRRLTEQGTGIIMISSEMPELLATADRILVMRGGTFTAEFSKGEASQDDLLRKAS